MINTEQLHDALTLLPDDLLEPVDALRQKKRFPWKSLAALAACLCLVVGLWFFFPGAVSMDSANGSAENLPAEEFDGISDSISQGSGQLCDPPPAEYETAVYLSDTARIELSVPIEWRYAVDEEVRGIRIWVPGQKESVITVYDCTGSFGVCGTGLEEETVTFPNGMTARIGTYDNAENWSFIFFPGETEYAITHTCPDQWWDSYGEEVNKILDTLTLN